MPIQYNNRMRLQLHLKVVGLGDVLLGLKCLLGQRGFIARVRGKECEFRCKPLGYSITGARVSCLLIYLFIYLGLGVRRLQSEKTPSYKLS